MPNKETSPIPPCKECSERTVNCHGTCEAYQNYSDQRKEINARQTEDFKLRTVGWGRGERMDKSVLAECSAMKEEIKDIRRRIEKDRKELDRLNRMVVSDSVACGKKGKKPLRTVKIQGRPETMIRRKEAALKQNIARLEHLEVELIELTGQAEEYISSIKKSELRIMFRLYFIDSLTYQKVADRMNSMFPNRKINYSDENVKKRIQRFLQMSTNVP